MRLKELYGRNIHLLHVRIYSISNELVESLSTLSWHPTLTIREIIIVEWLAMALGICAEASAAEMWSRFVNRSGSIHLMLRPGHRFDIDNYYIAIYLPYSN